jgi:hypothetical protein
MVNFKQIANLNLSFIMSNSFISFIVQQGAIGAAVDQLIYLLEDNNGRLPHQAMENEVHGLSSLGIKVDRHFINYRKLRNKIFDALSASSTSTYAIGQPYSQK